MNQQHGLPRHVIQGLALSILCTALFVGALESIVRLSGAEQIVARRVSQRMYPVSPGGEDGLFATRVFDPVLSWRLKPNGWLPGHIGHINSLGFIGKELEWKKAPRVRRILTMGDSVTYGLWGCGRVLFCRHNPYPSALELLLWERTSSDGFEVVDAGAYGYSSLQGLRYYRTYLASLNADIVTIMFGWNDHGMLRGFEGRELRTPILRALADGVGGLRSYRTMVGLTALALMRADNQRPPLPAAYRPRVDLGDFAYNLERLVDHVRRDGAHAILITEPFGPMSPQLSSGQTVQTWSINGLKDYQSLVNIHERYNDNVRAVAQHLGVALVDADAEFNRRDKTQLFDPYDMVHPNEAGHRLIAEMVYERLVGEHWAPAAAMPQ